MLQTVYCCWKHSLPSICWWKWKLLFSHFRNICYCYWYWCQWILWLCTSASGTDSTQEKQIQLIRLCFILYSSWCWSSFWDLVLSLTIVMGFLNREYQITYQNRKKKILNFTFLIINRKWFYSQRKTLIYVYRYVSTVGIKHCLAHCLSCRE